MTARAIPLSGRSVAAILATSTVGLLAFLWPMLAPRGSELLAHASDAPLVFGLLVPLLLALTLSLVSDGAMSAKAVALLGVLAATAAALRAIGAGIAGLEPVWIVIVLGGYALGTGFGFVLGAVCLLASALLTGGVGPWLPFQMIGAAWVGMGAGLLAGRLPRRWEIGGLAAYATVAAVGYGWLLNLWFWPTATGLPEAIAFQPGAGWLENLQSWFRFNLTTSLGYDVPRAILTCVAIVLLGRRVLDALRRTSRIAAFDARPEFATTQPVVVASAPVSAARAPVASAGAGSAGPAAGVPSPSPGPDDGDAPPGPEHGVP
jgi:energy-coupling factor transport system substrate-specific component